MAFPNPDYTPCALCGAIGAHICRKVNSEWSSYGDDDKWEPRECPVCHKWVQQRDGWHGSKCFWCATEASYANFGPPRQPYGYGEGDMEFED